MPFALIIGYVASRRSKKKEEAAAAEAEAAKDKDKADEKPMTKRHKNLQNRPEIMTI